MGSGRVQKATLTLVSGTKVRPMAMGFMYGETEIDMRVSGDHA